MRIAMITSSVSRLGGGLYTSVRRLGQSLQELSPKISVHVLSATDRHLADDIQEWVPLNVRAHVVYGPWGFRYSPGIELDLRALDIDLVHVQHLWMYPSLASLRWHRKTSRPFVVSPRGMIDEWAMSRAKLKKWIAWHAFEKEHLTKASCIHALGESEIDGIRRSGIRTPICVIPNGVDVPEQVISAKPTGCHQVLFLGRLHPKKGIRALIDGWQRWQRDEKKTASQWQLVLAGWGEPDHIAAFRRQAAELEIQETVEFIGPTFGMEKSELLKSAAAFILPSFSEGLPMAVLEAWAYKLPVLITRQCNLGEGIKKGAAIEIQPSPESIREGLSILAGLSVSQRSEIGNRGHQLVLANYSWQKIASQMKEVYEWTIGGSQAPASVITS